VQISSNLNENPLRAGTGSQGLEGWHRTLLCHGSQSFKGASKRRVPQSHGQISNNISGDPLRAGTGRKGRIAALHTLIG